MATDLAARHFSRYCNYPAVGHMMPYVSAHAKYNGATIPRIQVPFEHCAELGMTHAHAHKLHDTCLINKLGAMSCNQSCSINTAQTQRPVIVKENRNSQFIRYSFITIT